LIDVGGTLRADGWVPPAEEEEIARFQRLSEELELSRAAAKDLVEDLRLRAMQAVPMEALPTGVEQRTHEVVRSALAAIGLGSRQGAEDLVLGAMGEIAVTEDMFFPGALDLLRTNKGIGLRNVIVSNTFWKNAASSVTDFERMGIAYLFDGVVTSLDVGYRKPHDSMFTEALRLAGCDATECVFIGNVEELDIVPAAERGMRTIRVCIDEPLAESSRADAVVTSLVDAAEAIRSWARGAAAD
jgi:beta-phosphoglucomutase-like phosphatase (HAD superfamily)